MTTTDKHREIAVEIAKRYNATGAWASQACDFMAALDAAHADGDKAGYERGVRQSAAVYERVSPDGKFQSSVKQAILSLITSPVPVWEHREGCAFNAEVSDGV